MTTTYSNKTLILGDLWLNFRDDEDFQDFIDYNDIGLPMAYGIASEIVLSTEIAEKFINETFDLLLQALEIEDIGYEILDDVFTEADRPK